jgi:predicted Zn-dependent protease
MTRYYNAIIKVLLSGLQHDTKPLSQGDLQQTLKVTSQGCSTRTWDLQTACLDTT